MAIQQRQDGRLRHLLTQECARLMMDEGITDFLVAKRKACSRLGVTNKAHLPTNSEIEQALIEYQRLFQSPEEKQHLLKMRQEALQAMRFLARFKPRLVGPVLKGTAHAFASVNLHLFADTPEDVMFFLMENNMPYEISERRLRLSNYDYGHFPVLSFQAGDIGIELTIFDLQDERMAPRSPVDGKPMQRANVGEVENLISSMEAEIMIAQ